MLATFIKKLLHCKSALFYRNTWASVMACLIWVASMSCTRESSLSSWVRGGTSIWSLVVCRAISLVSWSSSDRALAVALTYLSSMVVGLQMIDPYLPI